MLKKRLVSLTAAFFVLLSAELSVFAAAGVTGGQISVYNPNTATLATGDAGTALFSDKASSAILNPASTIGTYRIIGSINNSLIFNTIQYNYLGVQFPSQIGNFGFSFMYAGFGKIDYRDSQGKSVSMGDTNNVGLILNYSIDLRETIPVNFVYGGIGVNLKLLRVNLADYGSESFAVDIGSILKLPSFDSISFAVAYKNFGPKIKFVKESYDLPQILTIGAAYQEDNFFNLKVALDYNSQIYSDNFFSLGASFSPIYFLVLRAGVKVVEKSLNAGFRIGFGFEIQDITLDYAYIPGQDIDGTHSFNLSCALGSFTSEKTAYDYYLKEHFRKAVGLYHKKDYIAARREFGEILAVYPEHAQSQKYLQKIDDELSYVDTYNMNLVNEYMNKANNALVKGDVVTARKNFSKVLDIDSENLLAKSGIEKVNSYSDEVASERNREENRDRINYLWKRFKNFYKNGDLVNSKEAIGFILEIDPGNQAAKLQMVDIDNQLAKINSDKINKFYQTGKELFDKGEYGESIKYFEVINATDPSRRDVKDLIAQAQKKIKNTGQDKKDNKNIKTQEEAEAALLQIYEQALNYYKRNKFDEALKYFKQSKDIAYRYKIADYAENSQKYISEINGVLSDLHCKKGFELYGRNKFEDAFKEYELAVSYNSSNVTAVNEYKKVGSSIAQKYYEVGMSYFSKGEFTKASGFLRKALVYEPDNKEAKRALERIR